MRLGDRTEETEVLLKRHDILERLCRSPAHVRDLVEEMDHSRSTINRALTELEELGFVERGDRGIEATTAGRLAADRLRTFFDELDDIFAAERVLDPLPSETLVSTEFVVDPFEWPVRCRLGRRNRFAPCDERGADEGF